METESGTMSQECGEVWRAKEDGREVQRHMNNRGPESRSDARQTLSRKTVVLQGAFAFLIHLLLPSLAH